MQKSILVGLTVLGLVALTSFANYQEKKGIGRVTKILGKEVYVLCEPLQEYEIVETMSTELGTLLKGGRGTIPKQIENTIVRGDGRVEKKIMPPYDAVMTADGDKIAFIRWK